MKKTNCHASARTNPTASPPRATARLLGSLGWCLLACSCLAADGPAALAPDGPAKANVEFWLESSLKRVFPASVPGATNLTLLVPRNGKVAFQACFRNNRAGALKVNCSVSGADDLKPRIRLVGLVPMPHFTPHTELDELDGVGHLPGLVPDPLWPTSEALIGLAESRSFWITLNIPADVAPGPRARCK